MCQNLKYMVKIDYCWTDGFNAITKIEESGQKNKYNRPSFWKTIHYSYHVLDKPVANAAM